MVLLAGGLCLDSRLLCHPECLVLFCLYSQVPIKCGGAHREATGIFLNKDTFLVTVSDPLVAVIMVPLT